MCGLISIITKSKTGFSFAEARAFSDALYMNALRGEDATGVAMFDNTGETKGIKDNIPSGQFIKEIEVMGLFMRAVNKGVALLGHNRKKTIGLNNKENAHPFIVKDRYTFVHNGTLNNHRSLGTHEVDSETLANILTVCEGDSIELEKVLGKVDGAYACIWIDAKQETIYWLRNKERPLFIADIPFGIVISSEMSLMVAALARNQITAKNYSVVEEDCLYSFKLNDPLAEIKKEGLTIKKYMPPTKGATPITITQTKTKTALPSIQSTGPSKNAFKSLRRRSLSKKIYFWVDDYVEKHYPSITNEWLLFGSNEDFSRIQGNVEGVTKDMVEKEWDGGYCSAIIEDMVFDNKNRSFNVQVKDIKLSPKSIQMH